MVDLVLDAATGRAGTGVEDVYPAVNTGHVDDVSNEGGRSADPDGHFRGPGDAAAAGDAVDPVAAGDDDAPAGHDGAEGPRARDDLRGPAVTSLGGVNTLDSAVLAQEVGHRVIGDGAGLGGRAEGADPGGVSGIGGKGVHHLAGADQKHIVDDEGVGNDGGSTDALPHRLAGLCIQAVDGRIGGADDDEVLPRDGTGGDGGVLDLEFPSLRAGDVVETVEHPVVRDVDAVVLDERA